MHDLRALHRDGLLCAPRVGVFRCEVAPGDALEPGRRIGTLQVLARRFAVVVPPDVYGEVVEPSGRGPLGYGDALLRVGEHGGRRAWGTEPGAKTDGPEAHADGWPVVAPIDGIFYRRPAPDAPPFVEVGDEVVEGQTLGLVEVMKTFNPVRYGAAGAPARGRIVRVGPGEQQEVAAGAVLFVVEPA